MGKLLFFSPLLHPRFLLFFCSTVQYAKGPILYSGPLNEFRNNKVKVRKCHGKDPYGTTFPPSPAFSKLHFYPATLCVTVSSQLIQLLSSESQKSFEVPQAISFLNQGPCLCFVQQCLYGAMCLCASIYKQEQASVCLLII